MADAPNSAYPPTGTVQMNQLLAGRPNVANTQAPPNAQTPIGGDIISQLSNGQQLNPQQLSAVTGKLGNAQQQYDNTQTSDFRQNYLNNSNLSGMQQNYEDLARKLFDYDSGNLAPQFQGQNPGIPSDAVSFGRVEASPLAMTQESAGFPANLGIYNNNPKYAYAAQATQGDSLLSLLDTLNKGIGDEYNMRAGTYKNTNDKSLAQIKFISDLLGQNKDIAMKKEELQNQKDIAKMQEDAALLRTKIQAGWPIDSSGQPTTSADGSSTNAYGSLRQQEQTRYNGFPSGSSMRAKIAGEWKNSHGYPLFPDDTINAVTSLKKIYDVFTSSTGLAGIIYDQNKRNSYDNQKRVFADTLAKAFGIQRNGAQVQALVNMLPNSLNPLNVLGTEGAFQGILSQMLAKNGMTMVKDKNTGDVGLEYIDSIAPNEEEIDINNTPIKKLLKLNNK